MRRTWSLLLGLTLAAAVLSTGPATASAEATFQLGIVADEGPAPRAGTTLRFDAVLESGGNPVSGVPVTLTARSYGGSSFVAIGHGTTAADGSVRIPAVLQRTSRIRWTFAGNGEYAPSASPAYLRTIGTRVAAHAVDRSVSGHQRVVVVGRAAPLKPGHRVSLWRGEVPCFCAGTGSTRVAVATIRPDGTFRLAARFATPGAKKLYVKVNAGAGNDIGYSGYVRIRVR